MTFAAVTVSHHLVLNQMSEKESLDGSSIFSRNVSNAAIDLRSALLCTFDPVCLPSLASIVFRNGM